MNDKPEPKISKREIRRVQGALYMAGMRGFTVTREFLEAQREEQKRIAAAKEKRYEVA